MIRSRLLSLWQPDRPSRGPSAELGARALLEPLRLDLPVLGPLSDPAPLRDLLAVPAEGLEVLADQIALDFGQRSAGEIGSGAPRGATSASDADGLGNVVQPEDGRPSQENHALERVLELAHVAGPIVAQEPGARLGCEPPDGPPMLRGELGEKVIDEQRDVSLALAERRHLHGHDAQPVEKVFSESSRRDHLAEVAVRRRDQPDVDLVELVSSHGLNLARLEHAQEL